MFKGSVMNMMSNKKHSEDNLYFLNHSDQNEIEEKKYTTMRSTKLLLEGKIYP